MSETNEPYYGIELVPTPYMRKIKPEEDEDLTLVEIEESTLRGRLAMAKARLEVAEDAFYEAIEEGRDVDAPILPRRRKQADVTLMAPEVFDKMMSSLDEPEEAPALRALANMEFKAAGNCPATSIESYPHPEVPCSFFPGHGPVVVVDFFDGEVETEVWKHGNHLELIWWNDPPPGPFAPPSGE